MKLFGQLPEEQMKEGLRRFKELTETGEIPTTQGQPAGRGGLRRGLAERGAHLVSEATVRPTSQQPGMKPQGDRPAAEAA